MRNKVDTHINHIVELSSTQQCSEWWKFGGISTVNLHQVDGLINSENVQGLATEPRAGKWKCGYRFQANNIQSVYLPQMSVGCFSAYSQTKHMLSKVKAVMVQK
jgi:hypothetical protein